MIQLFFTFRTPITDVLRTYALGSVKHFCRGASTYSKIESSLRLQSDRRARPLTMGSSSSLWLWYNWYFRKWYFYFCCYYCFISHFFVIIIIACSSTALIDVILIVIMIKHLHNKFHFALKKIKHEVNHHHKNAKLMIFDDSVILNRIILIKK